MSTEQQQQEASDLSPPSATNDESHDHGGASEGNEEAVDAFDGETFTVTSTLFHALKDMGFSENAIKKSIAAGCINEDTCTQWISMHHGHPELDTPLDAGVRVLIKEVRVLTEEEKIAKAKELKEFIRQKKAQESEQLAQQERENEKKRIEMGKLMLEAKEQREAAQRLALADERRREKEADARAREKVQLDLAIDKLMRQGRTREEAYGIAKEELEERKKRQREEAAEKLKALQDSHNHSAPQPSSTAPATSSWNLSSVVKSDASQSSPSVELVTAVFNEPTIPDPTAASMSEVLQSLARETVTEDAHASCVATLKTILTNIVEAPLDNKKRTLKVSSSVFRSRIGPYASALRLLRTLNFELTPDAEGQMFVSLNSVVLRHIHRALEVLPTTK